MVGKGRIWTDLGGDWVEPQGVRLTSEAQGTGRGAMGIGGFGPANGSAISLMPWGKGATPCEPTVENVCKQREMVDIAPDIDGARSAAHEFH